jgi:hypothetical protein
MKSLAGTVFVLFAIVVAVAPGAAAAAGPLSELTIHNTALQKMLMNELFVDEGRYHLLAQTACQYAYVDSPTVRLSQGRVRIKARVSAKVAMEVGDQCVGTRADVVQVAISAKPVFSGEKLVLTDIRLDEISNEGYRVLLQQFLASAIPRAITIDVREGLQRILADRQSTYDVLVDRLSVTDITAENDKLHLALTFALTAR